MIMKTLKWIAYVSALMGMLLVALGSVSAIFHLSMFHVNYIPSYFHGANSFFLITIIIFLYIQMTGDRKI